MKKYKISNGKEQKREKKKINIKKLILFALYTILIFAIYFLYIKAYFLPITYIYLCLIAVGALIYVPLQTVNLLSVRKNTQESAEKSKRMQRAIKVLLFICTPLLLVIFADYLIIALSLSELIYK